MSMLGNVQFLITSICSGVIFAIVLVAANTMAMSIRERGREIGILKAIGVQNNRILVLLLAQSVLMSWGGAILGILSARGLYSVINLPVLTNGFLQRLLVSPK